MHPQFTITKDRLIELINSFDLNISSETDSSIAGLEDRLSKALDGSQDINIIPDLLNADGEVDVDRLPKYELASGRKMMDEVRRHTMADSAEIARREMLGLDQDSRGKEQAFYDLRQTFLHFANHYDNGCTAIMIRDQEETSVIYIRVLEVRKAFDATPLFLLLYSHDLRGRFPMTGQAWIEQVERERFQRMFPVILASHLEQHLLLRLLDKNARRVPSTFKRSKKFSEKDFKLSFLLPVSPLSGDARDAITLRGPSSCVVCGEASKTFCGGCRTVYYCSLEHAKANWKSHKSVCQNLKGATWITVPFQPNRPDSEGRVFTMVSMKSMNQGPRKMAHKVLSEDDGPPPNVHGSQPFMVKIQWPRNAPLLSMSMYDQDKSLMINVEREDCPDSEWEKLRFAAEGATAGHKLFVWARRKADLELSLAIDRLPPQTFSW